MDDKVTVRIDKDEWYPVYSVRSYGREVTVDAEVLARWKAAEEAFEKAQDEMRQACIAARDAS